MANKMTQKDYYNMIIKVLNGEEVDIEIDKLVEFCNDRIDKLAKKSSGSKKPTARQIENEDIANIIVTILGELDNPTTVSSIAIDGRIPEGAKSTQRLAPILKKLCTEGVVVRTEEKGKAYFSLAEE